jgi:hypothetical protein
MKPVVLAVLLLLTVASIASGVPVETDIVSGDTTESGIVSGVTTESGIESVETTESGKSRYGNAKCLPVILQMLQLLRMSLCLITSYVMTYGEMYVKRQAIYSLHYRQKCR